MAEVGLLVIGSQCQENIAEALDKAAGAISKKLYVRVDEGLDLYEVLLRVYVEASKICNSLDIRVIIDDSKERKFETVVGVENESFINCYRKIDKPYRAVVVGGTFDRLHNGHKVLLSRAVLAASERIVCGVTCGDMIKKKVLWELMEPLEKRLKTVQEFVEDISCNVYCEVHPIVDLYGPSITDPDLQAIIVSDETEKGGHAVNGKRREKNLSILDLIKIGIIIGNDEILKEYKLSSSARRRALLGTFLKPLKLDKFPRPFVIALTGGIASGKTDAANFLAKNDCEVISCDKLADVLYCKETIMAEKIVEIFGNHVMKDGTVDRKALEGIVFVDEGKLKVLNGIVWPFLRARIKKVIAQSEAKVIVIDTAILMDAGWDLDGTVHQVWSCIVPPCTAIERIMERDRITADEAKKRLQSQMNNLERVQRSDVVICSMWSYEETRRQLLLALSTLRSYSNHHCLRQYNPATV